MYCTAIIGLLGVIVGASLTYGFNIMQREKDNKQNAVALYWYLYAQLRQFKLFFEDTQKNTKTCRAHPSLGKFIAGEAENLFFYENIIYVHKYLDKVKIEMLFEYHRYITSVDFLEGKMNEMKRDMKDDREKELKYTEVYDEVFMSVVERLNEKIEKEINPLMDSLWKKLS